MEAEPHIAVVPVVLRFIEVPWEGEMIDGKDVALETMVSAVGLELLVVICGPVIEALEAVVPVLAGVSERLVLKAGVA